MSNGSPGADEGVPAHRYTASVAGELEERWQRTWAERGTFEAPNPAGPLAGPVPPDKLFVQDMFPYPSGAGLHVGHPLGYIGTDVFARYHRMTGRNVLHTMGFDAFGLPAEQYAMQSGRHPRTTTEQNIERFLGQIRRLGLGHDERRRVATIDPGYYRWTQWIFLQIFDAWYDERQDKARPIADLEAEYAAGERPTPDGRPWTELSAAERRVIIDDRRLAYLSDATVNWCPGLGTVVANEEVTADGRSDRGNFPVFRKTLRQWKLRITAYADRLLDDLDPLDWPDKIKTMQRNWIGRSTGAALRFPVQGRPDAVIEVFTTRPDTVFGATYLVLAPEHPLVDMIIAESWPDGTPAGWTGGAATPGEAVAAYRAAAARKSELDRQESRDKTGIFLGGFATNPANQARIPIFVADYVLSGYGTGAIMAVPGQDQRDWDFAEAFSLPIIRTVQPPAAFDGKAYLGEGPAINSGFLDGLDVDRAKQLIIDWLETNGHGEGRTQYKMRDWLFARQRYWGEPFPIVYDEHDQPVALPEHLLPVVLPEVDDYTPRTFDPDDAGSEPSPPLSRAADWIEVDLNLGDGPKRYRRDANVMPQWAGSSWYQLRYVDPTNAERICEPENERYWLGPRPELHGGDDQGGVDLYVGGQEHAVLHLLYARFWQKVLFDLGHVSGAEPYRRLYNQGYIQAYAYTDARGSYVPAEEVTEADGRHLWNGQEVRQEYGKMGKSLKNVVTPDEMCERYGADTFRFYEMAMGPLDVSRPWSTKDVIGAQRFLQRVWRTVIDEATGEVKINDDRPDDATLRLLHRTIAGVHDDYAQLRFNTAGAKLIELNNHLTRTYGERPGPRAVIEPLVLMLAPLCPHVAEELWQRLGHAESLAHGPFPAADEHYLAEDTVEYRIQVNGKLRGRVTVPADIARDDLIAAVLAEDRIAGLLGGDQPRKTIVVPGRLVNLVI